MTSSAEHLTGNARCARSPKDDQMITIFIYVVFIVSFVLLTTPRIAPARGGDEKPKPLTQTDLLRLLELQISEQAIIERLEKSGLEGQVDGSLLDHLDQAGASVELVAAV